MPLMESIIETWDSTWVFDVKYWYESIHNVLDVHHFKVSIQVILKNN